MPSLARVGVRYGDFSKMSGITTTAGLNAVRVVLVHYHIFKNSGSSFDHAVQRNIGSRLFRFDAPPSAPSILQDELAEIIGNNADKTAFSSHTIRLPVPVVEGTTVLPVVFVRHPLLRLKSIYTFLSKVAWRQELLANIGLRPRRKQTLPRLLAQQCKTFPLWIEHMLRNEEGIRYISNSQTRFLSGGYNRRSVTRPGASGHGQNFDLHAAIENLAAVPLLGRTEHFDTDVASFAPTLAKYGLAYDFQTLKPKNVSNSDFQSPASGRVTALEKTLGDHLTGLLKDLLQQDLELYRWVNERLDSKRSGV